ncbi:MAG: hypothetical protein KC933_29795 [Myxococcales bacterium]|nr:hypothetical protein [Myxococcales bacterium]MCB9649063.1 hypothetical protein [Deltaproteobacteria bacterium]
MNTNPLRRGWARPSARAIASMVDAPVRHAFLLAGRPALVSVALVVAGAVLVAGVGALAALLTPGALAGAPVLQHLGRLGVALAMVVPGAVILGAWAHLPMTPRVWLGALAVALVTAAVVLISGVPFLLYLALVARAGAGDLPNLLLVAATLVAVLATLGRVVRSASPGAKGLWAARLLGLALVVVFVGQAVPVENLQAILRLR